MDNQILHTLAFPWFLYDDCGNLISQGGGTLFDLPAGCEKLSCIDHYRRISSDGWSVCPAGFAVYCRLVESWKLVVPGLKVTGLSTAVGKNAGLTIKTNKEKIEKYVDVVVESALSPQTSYDQKIRDFVHEIRGLNANLLHAATQLRDRIEKDNGEGDFKFVLVQNILALSTILSNRMTLVELIANPELAVLPQEDVPVYKKFDKLIRCFKAIASSKTVAIDIKGYSHGLVSGPSLFEIVPYLAIDNAMKYSPPNGTIEIFIQEYMTTIECTIRSTGPSIEPDEKERVFDRGYRGRNAVATGIEGSGLGLSVLRYVIRELFHGAIAIRQGPTRFYLGGVPYKETVLELSFPKLDRWRTRTTVV